MKPKRNKKTTAGERCRAIAAILAPALMAALIKSAGNGSVTITITTESDLPLKGASTGKKK